MRSFHIAPKHLLTVLVLLVAPVSSQLHARSVREDTAELATYQLADKTERQNSSILARNRSLSFRTTFSSDVEADDIESPTTANTSSANWGPEPIEETSEPEPSPSSEEDHQLGESSSQGEEEETDDTAAFGESPSLLTRALRRSPPHTPSGVPSIFTSTDQQQQEEQQPRNGAYRGRIYHIQGTHGRERSDSNAVFSDAEEDGDEVRPGAKRPQVRLSSSAADGPANRTSTAASHAPTESTPLLGNPVLTNGSVERAGYDLEGQKNTMRRRILGIFGRHHGGPARSPTIVVKDKIRKTYRSVKDLKWWDRRRLWENVVVAPIACLPAVIVGLLLNILDALSYGKTLFAMAYVAGISYGFVADLLSF